ncbi:hypothetical protein QLX08_003637 [Tetragonisca angustula]|uniref:Uncharacterized protein n=1 Tax=Tetragonisca angustula TaxID=166442 RepID=A0AAW1A7P8_9HYME
MLGSRKWFTEFEKYTFENQEKDTKTWARRISQKLDARLQRFPGFYNIINFPAVVSFVSRCRPYDFHFFPISRRSSHPFVGKAGIADVSVFRCAREHRDGNCLILARSQEALDLLGTRLLISQRTRLPSGFKFCQEDDFLRRRRYISMRPT